jgi:hypothetical protein
MGAEDADDDGHDGAEDEAGVVEGVRHGEDARAEGALEEMKKRAEGAVGDKFD